MHLALVMAKPLQRSVHVLKDPQSGAKTTISFQLKLLTNQQASRFDISLGSWLCKRSDLQSDKM